MARLPTPGSDNGQWGTILNDFLSQEHNNDGTLKKSNLITGAEQTSNKGQPNGYAPLDNSGIVPSNHLPAAAPDASATTRGLIQLAGDLAGTAASPTVPGLADKVDTSDPRLSDPRLTVKKAGATIGLRKNLNLIEGSNTTLTVSDNPGSDAVDVTVTLGGSGGTSGIPQSIADAKGDLIVGTGPAAVTRLGVGTDGLVLTADSTTGTGLKWGAASAGQVIQKDGAATTQRPILDFEAGSLVVDDAANNRTKVYILQEYLNITDPRIGVVMNAAGDQGPQLQAGIDLAGSSTTNACLFIPPGVVECHQQLNMPANSSIRILGAGSGQDKDSYISQIYFPTDLGSGAYGLYIGNIGHVYHIEKLMLQGPGDAATTATGTMPAQMYGMYNPSRNYIEDVRINGFGAAVGVINDHQEWHGCDFSGNGYGMDWIDNPSGGLGDQYLDRCNLTNQTRAGIAVSWSNTIANCRFIQCQFGNSPYAIYRYTGGGTGRVTFLAGCVFDNCSFINCANGIIYDEPGLTGLQGNLGVIFDSMYESGTFTGPAWGALQPAAVHSYSATIHWRGSAMPLFSGHATVGSTFMSISDDNFDFDAMAALGAKPFLAEFVNANHSINAMELGTAIRGAGGSGGSVLLTAEAVSKGDLLEMVSYSQIQRCRANGSSQIVGVAAHDANANEACVFLNQADSSSLQVKNKSGSTITDGSLLKPDTANIGCVTDAASPSDGPIVGRVNGGDILNNASGRAQIMI